MLSTTIGKCFMTFLISMVPVIELRLGLPYGLLAGLTLPQATISAILGNLLPVPFIIFFIRAIFRWLRKYVPRMDRFISKLENRAQKKEGTIEKYGLLGLILLVAIPLPGTGAWTGSLVAALFNIQPKKAIPCVIIGVCIAAIIMITVTKLGIFAFF